MKYESVVLIPCVVSLNKPSDDQAGDDCPFSCRLLGTFIKNFLVVVVCCENDGISSFLVLYPALYS